MTKISIVTLGCKVNQYESENLAEELEKLGYSVDMGIKAADVYVLNTCAVTNEAERKSRNMITKLLKLNPNAYIFVCGCAAVSNNTQFEKNDNIFVFSKNNSKDEIANLIKEKFPLASTKKSAQSLRVTDRTRAVLWVQTGCNNFCTYCLIPYLRGREVSFDINEIKRQAEKLAMLTNEVVVAGINLSAYGNDIPGSEGLIEVARVFRNLKCRFRFSSLEVNVITEKFLRELKTFDNFCDHFHLSLQSGCDRTLKFMNRKYTTDEYYQKVELIRKYFPNSAITTDLIVGFPTETEEDFEESVEFAKKVNFASMHIFPYSKRKGTAAEKFKNVATDVSGRVNKITQVAEKMKEDFITKNIGKVYDVVIENKKGEYYLAHTKNYILCFIKSDSALCSNDVKFVKIEKYYNGGAIAKLV